MDKRYFPAKRPLATPHASPRGSTKTHPRVGTFPPLLSALNHGASTSTSQYWPPTRPTTTHYTLLHINNRLKLVIIDALLMDSSLYSCPRGRSGGSFSISPAQRVGAALFGPQKIHPHLARNHHYYLQSLLISLFVFENERTLVINNIYSKSMMCNRHPMHLSLSTTLL